MEWRERLISVLDRNFGYTDEEPAEVVADRLIEAGVVREITTCVECANCDKVDDYEYWCNGWGWPMRIVRPDDFCSKGTRE